MFQVPSLLLPAFGLCLSYCCGGTVCTVSQGQSFHLCGFHLVISTQDYCSTNSLFSILHYHCPLYWVIFTGIQACMYVPQLKTQQIPVPRTTNKCSIPWCFFTPELSEFSSSCLQLDSHFPLVFSSVFFVIISLELLLLEWPVFVALLTPKVTFQLFFF